MITQGSTFYSSVKRFPFGLPLYIQQKFCHSSIISEERIPVGHLIRNDILGTFGVLCREVLSSVAVLKDPLKIMLFYETYK